MQVNQVMGGAASTATKPEQQLGQKEFLALMTAQLQNQDPFKPMENGEFLGQMAQFSQVTGLQELNDKFASLADRISGDQALQAASLIGREVLVESDSFRFDSDSPEITAAIETSGAANITVDVMNASGALVRQIDMQFDAAGINRFNWDGRNDDGELLASGSYQFQARQNTAQGSYSLPVMVSGQVQSVGLGGASGTQLVTDALGEINMGAVRALY